MRTSNILIVEDNPADQRLITEALTSAKARSNLHLVSDGDAAMEFLHKQGEYRDSPRPQLVLLDLNLPKKDGREVLREIKSDPTLQSIAVVMFSTSLSEQDIENAYSDHANAYVVKPTELDEFFATVRAIEAFWCAIAQVSGFDWIGNT